jgi:hypothetical protein
VADLRVPMDPLFAAFGVPATVIRPAPDDEPIAATGIWDPAPAVDAPAGMEFQRRDPRHVMAFDRLEVPTLPLKSVVVAPEKFGGLDRTWVVDGLVDADDELVRVLLVASDTES